MESKQLKCPKYHSQDKERREIKVETYYTDYWKAHEGILPSNRHVQSKEET